MREAIKKMVQIFKIICRRRGFRITTSGQQRLAFRWRIAFNPSKRGVEIDPTVWLKWQPVFDKLRDAGVRNS
jgi:hypothetical protein